MILRKITLLYSIGIIAILALSAVAQNNAFSDPNVDYTFSLPNEKWKMTVKPSVTSPNVEYVYGDRIDGHLEIRKLTLAKNKLLTDLIHNDEEQKLAFKPGFVAGKDENFTGHLRGTVFNFEYVASGRNMAGCYYYLRANDTTIYVLRFAGKKDELKLLRSQTDSIARTFALNP